VRPRRPLNFTLRRRIGNQSTRCRPQTALALPEVSPPLRQSQSVPCMWPAWPRTSLSRQAARDPCAVRGICTRCEIVWSCDRTAGEDPYCLPGSHVLCSGHTAQWFPRRASCPGPAHRTPALSTRRVAICAQSRPPLPIHHTCRHRCAVPSLAHRGLCRGRAEALIGEDA
jgi:hypothetical protein